MANLKHTDIPYIQKFVESIRGAGYVLDFSDVDFRQFIKSVSGLDIDQRKYHKYGGSKGKRLKSFLEIEGDEVVGKTLKALVEHWEAYQILNEGDASKKVEMSAGKAKTIANRLLGKKESQKEEVTEEEFLDRDFEEIPIDKIGLDDALVKIISERIFEIRRGIRAKTPLSVIFLCGSSLEGILLGVGTSDPKRFNQAKSSPKDAKGKVRPFHEWPLASFINVGYEVGLLGLDVKKFSHAMRDFRNYIHPYEQWSSGFNPDHHTAKISWQVLQAAIYDLSKSV